MPTTVTGTFVDDEGVALSGKVTFSPTVKHPDAGLSDTYVATLDGTGAFSISLPSGNNTGPVPFQYTVRERTNAGERRVYDIDVTGASLALRTVAPNVGSVSGKIVRESAEVGLPGKRTVKAQDFDLAEFRKALVAAPAAASVSGAVTVNLATAPNHVLTLTGNVTSLAFSNEVKAGEIVRVELVQDGTGSRTLSGANAAIKWAGGSAPTLSTTANRRDIFTFRCAGGTFYEVSRSMNVSA